MKETAGTTKGRNMSEAKIIDGKRFAERLRENIAAVVSDLKSGHGLQARLDVIIVGDNPASRVYVRNKRRQTEDAGMTSVEHKLSADVPETELLALVERLNGDTAVNGILVQLPLPDHIDEHKVIAAISPEKDVDGFHVVNVGRLWIGAETRVPCTPYGCLLLLRDVLGDLKGKRALVLGRSNIVGKPMAALLLAENCTVTIAHSKTKDLADRCREAEILVAAVGRPEMVRGDWVKPGAVVIDVGINRVQAPELGLNDDGSPKSRLVGDVAFDEAKRVAGAITPVPGGIGPMTIACLLRNTLIAAVRQNGLPAPAI
jgi:methylenetetrahydrofolate dehydrogenase (NADP+)/methenyltetrahydrofolate cyclohydrolase